MSLPLTPTIQAEIYHDALSGSVPFTLDDATAQTVNLTVTVQGCHETDPQI